MITRDDVAKHAGVSKTTVSRVLNNNGYVSPENRKKVERAIAELGYRPNLIARSLKTKQTRQILFYAPELSNPFYIEVYRGMEDFVEKQGYSIVVSSRFDDAVIRQRQFDGIILSLASYELQERARLSGIPAVITNYSTQPPVIPYVGIDIEEGAILAMEHLLGCGHRRIAYLTNSGTEGDQRYAGYFLGMGKTGIAPDTGWVIQVDASAGRTGYEQGYQAACRLIKQGLGVTAVFAFNDVVAIGAMAAFQEKHIKIPDDLSIIGFDDIPQAQYATPPLTTIRMPAYEQGWESAGMLLRLIRGEAVEPLVLKTQLIMRGSTAKLGPVK